MAGKLFLGFDNDRATSGFNTSAISASSATVWANNIVLPNGVYHNRGIPTLDRTIAPPNNAVGATQNFTGAGRSSNTGSYIVAQTYTGASATTRATWATAQGQQLAFVRSVVGIGNEFWATFDMSMSGISASSYASSYAPTNSWAKLFVWGDVEVLVRETTYAAPNHTVIFSIRNNGSEVATVTVPNIPVNTYWMYARLHVKLDATTGLIEMAIDGNAQSVAYTGQNTVTTTPLAAAPNIFIGPPILDNGTNAFVGGLDNVWFDDAAFPAGRISVVTITPSTDGTLTNFAAVGTSPTTVSSAVSDPTDPRAGRATASGGTALLIPLINNGGVLTIYLTDVLGIELVSKRITNRNAATQRRLQVGYSLSSVQTLGDMTKSQVLPFSSLTTPPDSASTSAFGVEQIFTKSGGGLMTKTELATMQLVLKSVAP